MTKTKKLRRTGGRLSPVIDVTRSVQPFTRLLISVRAGGRCEFDGCNEYTLEHHLTLTAGNFGQAAHIVAFKPDGPRGREGSRPENINDAANLMLLCLSCHKLIDDHPKRYTRQTLETYKRNHEVRIKHLTSLGPAQKTAVFVVKALVNGDAVSVPFDHIVEATAPRYPTRSEPDTVDLTTVSDRGSAFVRAACDTIKDAVDRFLGPGGEGRRVGHASIFALAPIPLLVFLGAQLTNKIPLDLFQRYRDTEKWTWKSTVRPVQYAVRKLRRSAQREKVALVLSLSGSVHIRDLPEAVRRSSSIYEITLKDQVPRTTFLRTRQDLEEFRTAFQEVMGLISQHHGALRAIDFFPAVPAPIAVLCGRDLLPKAHPALRVWDYDKGRGGFTYQFEVNKHG